MMFNLVTGKVVKSTTNNAIRLKNRQLDIGNKHISFSIDLLNINLLCEALKDAALIEPGEAGSNHSPSRSDQSLPGGVKHNIQYFRKDDQIIISIHGCFSYGVFGIKQEFVNDLIKYLRENDHR